MGKIVDIERLQKYHENLTNNVLTTKQDNITDLETIRTGAAAGATALADAQAYVDGKVDGKFDDKGAAAAAQSAAEATAAADATSKANAAESAAKTYADGLVKDAEGKVKFDAVGSAAAAQSAAEATAAGLYQLKGDYEIAGTAAGLNTAMDERVAKLEAIDHEKIALDASATAVAAIVAGADSDFDTLKEVADWILSDTTGAAGLQTTVSGHTEDIKEINDELDALDANKQAVISDLETIRTGAAAGATALQADDLEYATNDDIDGLFA